MEAALVMAVDPGEIEPLWVLLPGDVNMMLENDPVLRERARLVGAEDVHRAKILDGVEALHHPLALGHGDRPRRQIGADQHGKHFGRETNRDRDGKQEGLEPIAFGEAIDDEDYGHHDEHEADEEPTHAVDAALEAGWRALPHDRLR